jgi:hypothetical protein
MLISCHIGQVLVRSVGQEPEVVACGLEGSLFVLVGCRVSNAEVATGPSS